MRQKKYLKDDWEVLKNNKTTDLKYSKHKQKKTRTKKSIINTGENQTAEHLAKQSWKQSKRHTLHKSEQRKIANFLTEEVQAQRQCNDIFKGKKCNSEFYVSQKYFKNNFKR